MKIILSRKGFDSSPGNGQVPSPIFPDGKLCFLPIPDRRSSIRFSDLSWDSRNLGRVVEDLTRRRVRGGHGVHLDPDLNPTCLPRRPGWRPLFGQADVAQRHLEKEGVSKEDIFLFFGWFRLIDDIDGSLTYVPGAPDLHVIFGWFQVEEVEKAHALAKRRLAWATYHPHVERYDPNTPADASDPDSIYVARQRLEIPGLKADLPGGGTFPLFKPDLCLTAPGCSRSKWRLPAWFDPVGKEQALSYHGDRSRWKRGKDCVYLNSVAKGQEFVLDCDHYPEGMGWLNDLFLPK